MDDTSRKKSSVSNAERCKRYREKRSQNSPQFLQQESERMKNRRKCRTPEQIERDRQTARERMRRKRATSDTPIEAKTTYRKTRKQKVEQRFKWKQYKRTYRATLSSPKKRRIREKDRANHQSTRVSLRENHDVNLNHSSQFINNTTYTPAAARKAIYRVKLKMPKHHEKYAVVVKGLISSVSPKKRKAIDKHIQTLTPKKRRRMQYLEESMIGFKTTYNALKQKRTKEFINRRKVLASQIQRLKKYRMMRAAATELGVRYNSLIKWSKLDYTETDNRSKRSDALPEDLVRSVQDFYVSPDISVIHAGKKTVLQKGMIQKQTLNEPYAEVYKKFQESNPNKRISFSKFVSLKPKHVESANKRKFRGCLCESCTNIEFQLKTINRNLDHKDIIKNKYVANNITLCEKTGQHRMECLKRECKQCGTQKMEEYIKKHGKKETNHETNWYQWETKSVLNEKTNTESKRKMLVQHSGSFNTLTEEFLKNLETFSLHIFHAYWQHEQYKKAKQSLGKGDVLCVMDFAENLTIRNQDECQSAHWYAQQVTIHPIVCYYADPTSENEKVITHEIVFISDDLTHDASMVEHCVKHMIMSLRRIIPITKVIQFTDGCSCQYKSKIPFYDISCGKTNHNVDIERHFFGSSHGKGPADGCSGVVKAFTSRALKSGTVLNTAREVFSFLTEKLTKASDSFYRTFIYVESTRIDRIIKKEHAAIQTVKGTRQLHCVKGIAPGQIVTRQLSCFCHSCQIGEGVCTEAIVDAWQLKDMLCKKKDGKRVSFKEQMSSPKRSDLSSTMNPDDSSSTIRRDNSSSPMTSDNSSSLLKPDNSSSLLRPDNSSSLELSVDISALMLDETNNSSFGVEENIILGIIDGTIMWDDDDDDGVHLRPSISDDDGVHLRPSISHDDGVHLRPSISHRAGNKWRPVVQVTWRLPPPPIMENGK